MIAWTGCQTGSPHAVQDAETAPVLPERPTWPAVSLEFSGGVLREAVHSLGEKNGGGLVLINGIGALAAPELNVQRAPYRSVVAQLAEYARCRWHDCGWYYLICPAGYEVLLELSLDQLPPVYRTETVAVSLGEGMTLYNVLALLSRNLGMAMAADDIVAESGCGELTLDAMPLQAALTGILQSARLAPGSFLLDVGEGYLFLYSPKNPSPADLLITEPAADSSEAALLRRVVSLSLPDNSSVDETHIRLRSSAVPLRTVLESLSAQLGVGVSAEEDMLEFPVNPCVLPKLPLRTAVNLVLRQWPVPDIGWEVTAEGIHIRRR